MKKTTVMLLLVASLAVAGCSGKFWGGVGGGALGAGAGYEYRANKEMDRIESDLNAGKIDQAEYDARKDQIKRMSLFAK